MVDETPIQKKDRKWREARSDEWKLMIREVRQSVEDGHMHINEWEDNFLLSIGKTLSHVGEMLTDKQDNVLARIWGNVRK